MEGFLTQPSPKQEAQVESPTEAATEPVTKLVIEQATTTITEQVTTTQNAIWFAFYNPSLLRDSDASNDYNFGYDPNPLHESRAPEFYHNDLKNRMMIDPALTAAEMGACDRAFGTRFIGEYYDRCQGDWMSAMNLAKTKFMEMTKSAYLANLDRFFEFLNSLEKRVEYRYRIRPLLMNPFTASGVPEIQEGFIEGEGWCLVYTFYTNAQALEVVFRIDCGYPPVSIADVVEPTTQSVPEPQPTTVAPETTTQESTTEAPETTTAEPKTTTAPPETTTAEPKTTVAPTTAEPETPTTTKAPETKEPEVATYEYLEPNDDKSPYELPQNSNNYSSYDEYKLYVDDLNSNPAGEWGGPLD